MLVFTDSLLNIEMADNLVREREKEGDTNTRRLVCYREIKRNYFNGTMMDQLDLIAPNSSQKYTEVTLLCAVAMSR